MTPTCFSAGEYGVAKMRIVTSELLTLGFVLNRPGNVDGLGSELKSELDGDNDSIVM